MPAPCVSVKSAVQVVAFTCVGTPTLFAGEAEIETLVQLLHVNVMVEVPLEGMVDGLALTDTATGSGFSVTTAGALKLMQPLTSVVMTEYDPAELTVMLCVVAPLLHR